MKKNIFIIVTLLIFVILAVIVSFIFLKNKTNEKKSPDSEKFANINIEGQNLDNQNTSNFTLGDAGETGEGNDGTAKENPEAMRLRQITTTPVIGFNIVKESYFGNNLVYYIRAGTGNIFYSDPKNNNFDNKISNTTVPGAYAGAISNNGEYVAIQAGLSNKKELLVGKISTSTKSINFKSVARNVSQVYATDESMFLYTIKTKGEFIIKQYYPISEISENILSIPFREITINWNNDRDNLSPYYVYANPAKQLEGVVYEIYNNTKKRLPISGSALSAVGNKKFIIYSLYSNKDNRYKSFIYNIKEKSNSELGFSVLPEKCINTKDKIVCAVDFNSNSNNLPDGWYKGLKNFSDQIISIEYDDGVIVRNLTSPEKVTGQNLDIVNLLTNNDYLLFMDKKKNFVWQYKLDEDF